MTIASELTKLNTNLTNSYTAVSDKGGTLPQAQNMDNLATAISSIPSGGSAPVITSLSITPTTSQQTITAPSGTDGYSPVNVAAVTASIDSNISAGNIKKDVSILGVTGTYEGSTPSGRYQLFERVKDSDTNREIGTVSGFFTDANGVEYAVVCLDARYRGNNPWYVGTIAAVTNMPIYSSAGVGVDLAVGTLKNTATQNGNWIRSYNANDPSEDAGNDYIIRFCRERVFNVNNIQYYGQCPNLKELFDICSRRSQLSSLDPTRTSYSTYDIATWKASWASDQYNTTNGWAIMLAGYTSYYGKSNSRLTIPVLEIPNAV